MKKISPRTLQNLELQNQEIAPSPEGKNILALDYGEKFCGLAFSPDGVCTFPLEVVETGLIEERMKEIMNNKSVHKLVVGLPLFPDGKENKLCGVIRIFAKKFETLVPVEFINERYSSKLVVPQQADRIDDFAAVKILEFSFAKK
jgi:RNase H-fold protein (predicted Holliday junction resolvase)